MNCVGRWYVKNIKPTSTGEAQEVKIKVRINANGVIQLTSANLVEKKLKEEIPIDNGNGETNNMEVGQEVCMHNFISEFCFSMLIVKITDKKRTIQFSFDFGYRILKKNK